MPRARIGTPSAVLAREPMPPKVCQYVPAAYHSRVVTFLLHIFEGCQNCQYSQTKIAQTEKGDNKYFS